MAADIEVDQPSVNQEDSPRSLEVAQNPVSPADVDGDRHVAPGDGLLLANAINWVLNESDAPAPGARFLDVSGDGQLSPADFDSFKELMNLHEDEADFWCGAQCLPPPGDDDSPRETDGNTAGEIASLIAQIQLSRLHGA